ncbi:MAG: hypothetical protein A9Z00_11215 [Thermobacillus sp. ZCTH02-B1]|uniref:hypothetical protein n=1 Tax=Thermobacillus sp. ZCTH02-B1 TaxID=1858795 RepID=UPI000B5550DE|nr:hypothetical protein [Thermobacillus sp. ZCTH02-B1]OUM95725.1 MAG: hypothetical protein A9Z00_11215 [Thermobacillus sp. ZCTH02-B1]
MNIAGKITAAQFRKVVVAVWRLGLMKRDLRVSDAVREIKRRLLAELLANTEAAAAELPVRADSAGARGAEGSTGVWAAEGSAESREADGSASSRAADGFRSTRADHGTDRRTAGRPAEVRTADGALFARTADDSAGACASDLPEGAQADGRSADARRARAPAKAQAETGLRREAGRPAEGMRSG